MTAALACVTGRFQPVHDDHLRLLRQALDERGRLVVGITNPDPGGMRPEPASDHRHLVEANPFTYFERLELLAAALASPDGIGQDAAAGVRFVPFDLARPQHWPAYVPLSAVQYVGVSADWEREKARRLVAAGYQVVEVPRDPATRRSASEVRTALRRGEGWEALVPPATVTPLRALLTARAGTAW